jgi:hypothetical protein
MGIGRSLASALYPFPPSRLFKFSRRRALVQPVRCPTILPGSSKKETSTRRSSPGTGIGIGAAGSPRRTPPTPPDVRVRIRRFGELRLRGKPWDAEVVEVARGQGDVDLPA